ncbi:hypothetical protein SAMN05216297_11274 [Flavobacterium phragmitis]|uniref:Uncharacterized protein n=1 Tax=Flavobacterium phragmitis TaxID=739143 RepID=A0A1I1VBS5_9FLAO|nr:hypothetical protein SAMN05216297_11274 [Flavobacterium phragmitis]
MENKNKQPNAIVECNEFKEKIHTKLPIFEYKFK